MTDHDHSVRYPTIKDENGKGHYQCPEGSECKTNSIHHQQESNDKLYAIFTEANPHLKISKTIFTLYKPFYMRYPNAKTCECPKCTKLLYNQKGLANGAHERYKDCGQPGKG